ncbi:flavin reductase [Nesterenkonia halotolerans]|uniref:flavin reductase family protein n=1 Tax=Nesterenkonia halotolerans TaxID=225325 RepID=UPI003EE70687
MDIFESYPVRDTYRLIEPGPTVLISTSDGDRDNLMTNAFNMPVRHDGILAVVVGTWDASFATLQKSRQCVIGVPGAELMRTTVEVGNCSGDDLDKWEHFGLTRVPGISVAAPLIGECVANIECKVEDDSLVEDYSLWLLRATAAWIRPGAELTSEFHHRGNGTFSTNGELHDLREHMTKWKYFSN